MTHQAVIDREIEHRLLAQVASAFLSGRADDLPTNLFDELPDQRALLDAARSQGMTLLLLRVAAPLLTEEIRLSLEKEVRHLTIWSMVVAGSAGEMVELLRAESINAAFHKGVALSQIVYGSPAARPFADLDLLVDARDVQRLDRIFRSAGFRPELPLEPSDLPAVVRGGWELTYQPETTTAAAVDLHWRLIPRWYGHAPRPCVLERASVMVGETEIPTLSERDAAIALAIDGFKDGAFRLEKLICFLTLLRRVDRASFLERARFLGCEGIVLVAMGHAANLFEDEAMGEEASRHPRWIRLHDVVKLLNRRFENGAITGLRSSEVARLFNRVADDRVKHGRERFTALLTPTVSDVISVRLPPMLQWMHPVIRPFRFAARRMRR